MPVFNITADKDPSFCVARRCSQTAAHTVDGQPWGQDEVTLCHNHFERLTLDGVDGKNEQGGRAYKVTSKLPGVSGPVPLPPPELEGYDVYWDREKQHWRFVDLKDKTNTISAEEAYAKYAAEIRLLSPLRKSNQQ